MKNLFFMIETVTISAVTIALCGVSIYVNEHPFKAFFTGISVARIAPIILVIAAIITIVNLIVSLIVKKRKEK